MSMKNAKPNFSQSQVVEMVKRLFGLTPSEICPLPSYDDQNFYLAPIEGGEYVLKILNSEASKTPSLTEVQMYAMSFLQRNGLSAQTARPTASGQLMSLEETDCGYGFQKYLVRLLTYLPGNTISKVPLTPKLLYETGKTAARMDKILQEMEHPHLGMLQRETFIWSLSNIPLLEAYIHVLDGDPLQKVVKSVIHKYKTSVVPKRSNFRECINHGDFSDLNVLVQPEGDGHKISGILDFGNMSSGYYIYELAITIMYMMTEHPKPIEVGGPVLAGWESVLPLNEAEKDCLYVLVLSRFCQSLVFARYNVILHPENKEYLMTTSRKGVHTLRQLWELGKKQVE
ncbi:hydroxylysine kinase-like, partial [Plectropomus leopardus]|uniref:hydroxylysine kinase-like n=1 Tax=Plectropomus leopardus TaxID=160734 RepID=UPI001C4B3C29